MSQPPPPDQQPTSSNKIPQRALIGLVTLAALFFWTRYCVNHRVQVQQNHNAGKTVRYEVTSDSTMANFVTYEVTGGQRQDAKATLPWSYEFIEGSGFQALVVNAQNPGTGWISCKILVDGSVLSEQTSHGQYATVMCNGS